MLRRNSIVFESGERYATLITDEGVPDFWVTLFVTVQLRTSHTQNAILSILQGIAHFKIWEQMNCRDLLSEFRDGRFLAPADPVSIRDHCGYETRSLRKWLDASQKKNVVTLNPARSRRGPALRRVSKAHQANRISHVAEYLDFTARALLRHRANVADLTGPIKEMKSALIAQKPKVAGRGAITEPDLKAPPSQVFDEFMAVVREDSDNNPYRNETVRFRNALMFEVMYHTGIRSGELLSLRVEDVIVSADRASVHVRRRHDDVIDPRTHQPVAKTRERTIPIPVEVATRLRKYIIDVRAHIPGATRHPFIFVSHHIAKAYRGRPISDSAFRNRILAPAASTKPELFEEITRHGFRHNFNYRLSKKIDERNERAKTDDKVKAITEKEEIQLRKQLNGWDSDSSAAAYNLRHIKELADALMKEDGELQTKNGNRGKQG